MAEPESCETSQPRVRLPRAACKYIRTGTNHYSLAFTYDWIASEQERRRSGGGFIMSGGESIMGELIRSMRNEGIEWPPRWDKIF